MAVFIKFKKGVTRVSFIKEIKEKTAEGKIDTWAFDEKTGFTHTAESGGVQQWNVGGYLKVVETDAEDELWLYYASTPNTKPVVDTYGTLNGRFSGMIMNRFIDKYQHVTLKDLRTRS